MITNQDLLLFQSQKKMKVMEKKEKHMLEEEMSDNNDCSESSDTEDGGEHEYKLKAIDKTDKCKSEMNYGKNTYNALEGNN